MTLLLGFIEDPEIIKEIPQWVKLVNLDIDRGCYLGSLGQIAKARLKKGRVPEAAALILKRGLRIGMTHSNQRLDELPKQNVQYDFAICYHIHAPFMLKYTAEKVKATKKVGWIHNDFRGSGYPVQRLTPVLSFYDRFIAVSESVAKEFKELCPQFATRTSVIHNILDEKEIWEKSKTVPADDPYFSDSRLKILTIGRFSEQKGINQAIEVCKRLRDQGLQFCWYLIGWGSEETKYRTLIETYSLNDCFIILGSKENPYPYLARCDLYVQPSRHEAYCMTVLEAKILYRPIVFTKVAGSEEQILSGETGYIVPIGDLNAMEKAIFELLNNSKERERLSDNLSKHGGFQDSLTKIVETLMQ